MRYYFMLAREKGACHATQGPTGKHQVWVRRQKQEQEEGLGHVSIGFSAGQAGQGRGTSFGLARWNPSGSLWAVEVVSGGPVSTQIDFGGGTPLAWCVGIRQGGVWDHGLGLFSSGVGDALRRALDVSKTWLALGAPSVPSPGGRGHQGGRGTEHSGWS